MNTRRKKYLSEKYEFFEALKNFANDIFTSITNNNEWTMRGFIDIYKNIYPLTTDSKVLSKILELHLLPELLKFAEYIKFDIEPASKQNWYPDFTFISRTNSEIKFAVDLKTTYRDEEYQGFCNGFTLGSHGEYFTDRDSTKNIQYPYNNYSGHFCLGIIYSRNVLQTYDSNIYSVNDINTIPAVIKDFTCFAAEKWKIASDKSGSGNTANIGSIQYIDDIINGRGVFSKASEELFDDYRVNFSKLKIKTDNGSYKNFLPSVNTYITGGFLKS